MAKKGGLLMKKIIEILEDLRSEYNFRESDNFIEDGFLDSFDIVALVSILEEKYNISIDGLDIVPENFETAEAIVKLIRKCGGDV